MQSGLCEMALLLFKINQVLEELHNALCVCFLCEEEVDLTL